MDKVLYVTCEQSCFELAAKWEEIFELELTQEADNRLLLPWRVQREMATRQPSFAQKTLTCQAQHHGYLHLLEVWNQDSHAGVDKIGRSQRQSACDSLIGPHAFTGCDSVSCFAGKGNLSALQLLKKD